MTDSIDDPRSHEGWLVVRLSFFLARRLSRAGLPEPDLRELDDKDLRSMEDRLSPEGDARLP